MPAAHPPAARARLEDVALLAGVSPATASRVLTGSAQVKPETRRQVERAISELGYVRNRAARTGGGGRKAGSIALVVFEDSLRMFTDPFFARLMHGVGGALAVADVQLVLLSVRSAAECRRSARFLREGHVDGAVFVSLHGQMPVDVRGLGVPVVYVGRPVRDAEAASYVDADNIGGAEAAVRHALSAGRRTVATIAGPPDMAVGLDRLRGYRKALAETGPHRADLVAYGDFSAASAEHAVYRLLDRRPDVDAVFATSDLMATGVLRALRRTGRRVPGDVAVIGFDDAPLARHTSPPLTTVRQPVEEIGARAVDELLGLIGEERPAAQPPRRAVFATQLIVRASG
ncbi:LacI family DNA-binding transcriptional regulator [Actinospica sp.]|uniref:LacI family DNA-binding transcriptional regulator n=1 Tax=Actinospica sp. TaxID=1872142 RepID=UPI002B7C1CE8|nr:LacI family DNA-binding transcriptional regulator [Actinospica sp.]HWG27621.1 LacI family DNA-binding transcriptional regulator [Actinospica sp.]